RLEQFDYESLPKSFVIKPAHGVAGGGIEIFFNKDKDGNYIRGNGSKISLQGLKLHMSTILDGKYSHKYRPDIIIIEERVIPYKGFRQYTYKGTPDVRVLLFRKVPVMAMIRWPTVDSRGKANLSEGAAASGIDIATGITTYSIKESKNGRISTIEYVDGTQIRYSGVKIPYWDIIMKNSVKSADVTGLGYCAVDFLIDEHLGALVVELNARPGLRIQLVNQDGLKWRLKQVKNIRVKSDAHAIRLGKDLFGGEIEEEIEAIAGKKVISLIQPVTLYSKGEQKQLNVKAKVDTGATYSSIDVGIARELGFGKVMKIFDSYQVPEFIESLEEAKQWSKKLHKILVNENIDIISTHIIKSGNGFSYRIAVPLKAIINDKILEIEVNIRDRSQLSYPVILGKIDLEHFLIDPSK
ncbi:MAG: sugar-transfer associated ATP-grasp domain-containing protein, partial [Candidatus Roizmanbacteria bacterium]